MIFATSALLSIASVLIGRVQADCQQVGGNYYCNQATAIEYSGIGYSGSYSDVTNMDESSCQCSQSSKSFSGTMSPLDEELSVHFRGPIKLAQFGVYYPGSGVSSAKLVKRDANAEADCQTVKHVHHKHKRAAATEVVSATATVWQDGASSSSSAAGASSDSWIRSSYYDAQSSSSDNITFLNHQGGTAGSGTWSSCFGNSLSYCGSDGKSGAGSSQVLSDVLVESNVEYLIMSASECGDKSATGDCGYYRSNIPAFHGFGGADKIFTFEFQMPSDTSGSSYNQDMPAIWLLNAKIPRTLQYGDSSCSCWSTGCGEMDLFEVLSAGSDKCISHLHDGQGSNGSAQSGGGSQDYFTRPTDSTMKAAVIFHNGNIFIISLDDSTEFGASLDASTVSGWLSQSASQAQIQ